MKVWFRVLLKVWRGRKGYEIKCKGNIDSIEMREFFYSWNKVVEFF